MTFKVGDEVVCVDAMGTKRNRLVAGAVYHIAYRGGACVSVAEVPAGFDGRCSKCGIANGLLHYRQWRFVKLPREKVDRPEAMPIEVGVE